MEVFIDEKRPDVVSTTNVVLALVLHVAFFIGVYVFAKMHFTPKETIIPIDLTVVVNENLDGVENEPPPVDDPPPPPPPEPKPPKVETPPPPPPEPKLDAVVKVPDKPKKPEEKKPEKPKETLEDRMKRMRESVKAPEKKPDPPKKEEPKKETREERMKRMRESASIKKVNIKVPDAPSGNGRTDRKTLTDKEIQDLLNKGYKPGSTTQIADSMMQFCISRVRGAIDARWRAVQPTIGAEGTVFITVRFNMSGAMVNCRLSQSCGDRTSDAAALTVVRSVGPIPGLDKEFLRKYSKEDLTIRYKVESR